MCNLWELVLSTCITSTFVGSVLLTMGIPICFSGGDCKYIIYSYVPFPLWFQESKITATGQLYLKFSLEENLLAAVMLC